MMLEALFNFPRWMNLLGLWAISGACWGLSMKGLKARIKVHIKLRKGKDSKETAELIDCRLID